MLGSKRGATLRLLRLIMVLASLGAPVARAQGSSTGVDNLEIRNAASVILVSGLVGGILGLSTLSFYEKPQDNIKNITIGAGIGVIAAALYITATAAQSPPGKASAELEPGFRWAPGIDAEGRPQLAASYRF